MVRRDRLDHLDSVRPGCRLSLRLETDQGLTDLIGLLLGLSETELEIEDRHGIRHTVRRDRIRFARQVPTVSRGRNPLSFETAGLRALAHDDWLAGTGRCWVARLIDLVDRLDDSGVTHRAIDRASCHDSRALVNGEWAAVRLAATDDLLPLAAWAARRNARNLVLTSPLPPNALTLLGLSPID